MEAKTYPLQEILKPERRYIIPTFQRDYEWTLEGQGNLLFEDLEATADRLLDVRGSGEDGSKLKPKEQGISPHFMGAIVCASLPFATGGVALRSVIDGQQRLTTIQLMMRGLLNVLTESSSDRNLQDGALAWPKDSDVEDAFLTRQIYGGPSQFRIRLLFGAIDRQLRSEDPNEPHAAARSTSAP